MEIESPDDAIKNKIALLTEERRATGIFAGLSVQENACIANLDAYKKHGLLSDKKMRKDTEWVIESMRVKTPSAKAAIKNLSGGNQQKVILGRWLLTDPQVLLLDEPTRGIDVGAKYEIYAGNYGRLRQNHRDVWRENRRRSGRQELHAGTNNGIGGKIRLKEGIICVTK